MRSAKLCTVTDIKISTNTITKEHSENKYLSFVVTGKGQGNDLLEGQSYDAH